MNKVYRVIWNASLGVWVAVSELAKSNKKRSAQTVGSDEITTVLDEKESFTFSTNKLNLLLATTTIFTLFVPNLAFSQVIDENLDVTGNLTVGGTVNSVNITTLENAVNSITTGNTALGVRVNTAEGKISTLESTVNSATTGNTALDNRVSTAEGKIGTLESTVNNTTTGLVSKASKTDLDTLTNKSITFAGNTGSTAKKLGETLTIKGGDNIATSVVDDELTVNLKKDISLTSVTATGAIKGSTLESTGNTKVGGALTVVGQAVLNNGAALNNKKITSLGAGDINSAISTDAVNGGQLYTVNNKIAAALGTTLDSSGNLTKPTYTVSDGQGATKAFESVKDVLAYITGIDDVSGSAGAGVGIKYFHTNSKKDDSQSIGEDSIAVGPEARANGISSIAMGQKANAYRENSVAIGKESAAIGLNSTAIGSTSGVAREPNISKDTNGKIIAIDGLAVTTDSSTNGTSTDHIRTINGITVTTVQVDALLDLLGSGANLALGKNSLALGTSNLATGESSIALGDSSTAVAKETIAIGNNASASGEKAIAMGKDAKAGQTGAVALGVSANADRVGSIALGQKAEARTTGGISIGDNAGLNSVQGQTNDRTDLIAIGRDSGKNVVGNRNIALGVGAGSNLSADASSSSDHNIAIGVNAGSNINGDDNIAIGKNANKNVSEIARSVAVGSDVDATTGSTVLGYTAKATEGTYATVVGYGATVTGNSGTALGQDTRASTNNVALGASSIADGTFDTAAYITGDTKAGGYNIVSVGQAGQERRITNLAAGSAATDAVNVSQLKVAQSNLANRIGGMTLSDDGSLSKIKITDKDNSVHEYESIVDALSGFASGTLISLPPSAVTYATDGRITNVEAGTSTKDAVNLGQLNQAIAENGLHHVSINSSELANQNNTGAKGSNSLAIGAAAITQTGAINSIALGFDISATAKDTVAIGNAKTNAEGDSSIAIGKTTLAKGLNNISMGLYASSDGIDSIAIGHNVQIDYTTDTSNYAVGMGSEAEVQNADQAIAIGRKAIVQGDNGNAIGHQALASAAQATALGNEAKASSTNTNAIGNKAEASGISSNAIGDQAETTHENATAIGTKAHAYEAKANAVGYLATASGESANAIGDNAKATKQNATAIGTRANATAENTTAIGTSAQASGTNAVALGNSARAFGVSATAIGNNALADNLNSIALGDNAKVIHDNAVALGANSLSGVAHATANATINGKTYTYAGTTPTSTVSIGSEGKERQIINLAAGRVTATSTDAINGSQLFQTNAELERVTNYTAAALGGGAKVESNGILTAPSYTVTSNPADASKTNTVNNVGAALTALNTAVNQPLTFSGDAGTNVTRKLGETLKIKGGKTTDLTDNNIGVVATGTDTLTVKLAKDINLGATGSIKIGDSRLNSNGLSFVNDLGEQIANTPSLKKTGIDAGNQQITNVRSGGAIDTNAANIADVKKSSSKVVAGTNVGSIGTNSDANGTTYTLNVDATTVSAATGGALTVTPGSKNATTNVTDYAVDLSVATKDNIQKGVDAKATADKGLGFAVNGGTADNLKLGETVNFANGTNTTASYDATTNTYTYNLNDSINLTNTGNVTVGNSKIDNSGVQAGTIKLDAVTGKITGLTAGTNTTDAVNVGQLQAVNDIANKGWKLTTNKVGTGTAAGTTVEQISPDETVTFIAGDNIAVEQAGGTVTVATKKDVAFDTVSIGGVVINKTTGINAGDLKITNVAKGEISATSKDAINGSQLHTVSDSVKTAIGGNTTIDSITGAITTSNIGGTQQNNIHDAISSIKNTADQANKGWNLSTNGELATVSNVKPSDTVDFSNTDGNVTVSNQGNNITVDLNKDIDLGSNGSVSIGDTKIDNSGLTIAGGPSVTSSGIDAGNKQVSNVADGQIAKNSKDAVNGGQIHEMIGASAYDANGNLTNIGGTGASNINDAIAAVNQNSVQAKTTVTQGSNIKVEASKNTDGSTNYIVSTQDDISLNSVTAKEIKAETLTADTIIAGNTTINSNGLSIKDGPSINASGIDAGNKVVTSVANGDISASSTQAVNGSQLNATNQAVIQYLGGGAAYNNITQSFEAPSYEVNGGKYNNVGDALGALNQADQTLGNRITNLGDQLQQAFYSTNQRIDDVEKRANAGIAAAMALETAPYIPGKYTYAAGAAYHGGENAVGLTLRKTADNGRWSLTGGAAAGSSGDPSVRIGISGVIH